MSLLIRQRPDKSMPVSFKSFQLGHILRRGVLSHSLEERMQHSIVILSSMNAFKSCVFDA